jgi:hypothetical protein
MAGFLSRLAPRRAAEELAEPAPTQVEPDVVVPSKALRKFVTCLRQHPFPTLLDLGPAVGSNIEYFGEQLGCKVFVEDIFSDIDRFEREHRLAELPAFLESRLSRDAASVDGILCWDLFDFLDKPSARVAAEHLMRVLKVDGVLFGFFSTAHAAEARFSKFIVADDSCLRHRAYSAPRTRQAALQNRDIIKLFGRLRVSDSFLLRNNVREIVFRKPDYLPSP